MKDSLAGRFVDEQVALVANRQRRGLLHHLQGFILHGSAPNWCCGPKALAQN
jgi:hypothetical protein